MLVRRTGTDWDKIRITSDNRRGEEEMESGRTLATTRECSIVDWIVLQPHRMSSRMLALTKRRSIVARRLCARGMCGSSGLRGQELLGQDVLSIQPSLIMGYKSPEYLSPCYL
jgi:hypothetical protein